KQAEIDAIVQGHISFMVTPHDHAHNSNGCGAPCPICQQQGQNGACKLASKHPGDHVCNVNSNHTWANDGIPGPHP
ncbi:MAG TPA: hypothetical protein VFQ30_15175, partial [Ktedonobacteraceae bacterium]|nr:hypothetical protein [Ktedonobacteraceae bacterium]